MKSAARLLPLALCVLGSSGCQSPEERCKEAVDPAKQAWGSYLEALEQVKGQAQSDHDAAKAELEQVEKRIDSAAREKADALNRKGTSAWYRTHNAARQSLCSDDEACSNLMGKVSQSELTVKEIGKRIDAARTLIAALGKADPLPKVEDDFDRRDLLASARQASVGVPEACAELAE